MNNLLFKPRDLKIIAMIAETCSIGQTATALGMAQANVSKYLADFETQIGLKVFDRTTRRLSLTPFGKTFLPHVKAAMENARQLNNFIADYKHEKNGLVTLYAPVGIISWLSNAVIHHIEEIGNITLKLKTCNLEQEAFYDGVNFPDECDIFITYTRPKDNSLIANRITQYAVTAFASPDYLRQHPITSPDELEHHSCILIESMMIDDANIWKFQSPESNEIIDYKVSGKYICDNTQTALALARQGLGVVFAAEESIKEDIATGKLQRCFPARTEWWLDLVAIYRQPEYLPWRVRYILDELLNIIRHQIEKSAHKPPVTL